jgi:molybdopterin-guanine dinucleotide biosynthesis protein A
MGGGDKPMRQIGGRTILGRVIARLMPQCDGLILNANGDPARFASFGLPVIPDSVANFPDRLRAFWPRSTGPRQTGPRPRGF